MRTARQWRRFWPRLQARTRRRIVAAGVVLLTLLCLRFWPHAPLAARVPWSTGIWSSDNELLRVTRSRDDQYRLWTPLSQISPAVVDAFLLKEDQWFYWHPGVNPVAIVRAAIATASGRGRQGGSTLTMQLARLMYRINTRTPAGKLRQMAAATWLEMRYSKHDLLETYLNIAPFGGNIQGVGAASRIYFGKAPSRLTLGEALTLVVIPQRPSSRAGRTPRDTRGAEAGGTTSAAGAAGTAQPEAVVWSETAALAARMRLGTLWLAHHGNTEDDRRQVALPIVARPEFALPWLAPHFVDAILDRQAGTDSASAPAVTAVPGRIDTTLDAGLQRVVERQVRQYLLERSGVGLHNTAALLVDTRDMAVKAWVGSADFWNESIQGQVNGVLAKRSPGSALKPFVYALALDQGVLHPQTMLRDAPTAFGPFAPENFDGRFFGPITAEDALIRSRNVPAVWVANQLKQPTLYQFLQAAGIRDLKPEAFYGLALALGGGEVTMKELAGLYAMLANQGVLRPLRTTPTSPTRPRPDDGVSLLSPEASFVTLEMLRHNPRPDDTGMSRSRMSWPTAWKTGTSWGFRDAWAAGVVGPYVLVVWIGNFDGQGNPAFIGVDAAAPVFFRIADALNLARPNEPVPAITAPAGVAKVAVCTGSGDLPNAYCPHTVDTWYIPGKSPIRVSQLHRAVAIDSSTGQATCPPYAAGTRFEVFEFWPSDMLELFRQAGMPRRMPPPMASCAAGQGLESPDIASPLRNVSYALRQSMPDERISLEATVAGDVQRVFWFDGRALIGGRLVRDGALPWRPTQPGIHLVRVVDDHGRSAERDVDIQFGR